MAKIKYEDKVEGDHLTVKGKFTIENANEVKASVNDLYDIKADQSTFALSVDDLATKINTKVNTNDFIAALNLKADTDLSNIVDLQAKQTTVGTSTSNGCFTKIASITLFAQYTYGLMDLSIMGVNEGSIERNEFADLKVRVAQIQSMTQEPYIEIFVTNSNILTTEHFIAVISENSLAKTIVDIYIKYSINWQTYHYQKILTASTGNTQLVELVEQQPILTDLPAGTQINSKYPVLPVLDGSNLQNVVAVWE